MGACGWLQIVWDFPRVYVEVLIWLDGKAVFAKSLSP